MDTNDHIEHSKTLALASFNVPECDFEYIAHGVLVRSTSSNLCLTSIHKISPHSASSVRDFALPIIVREINEKISPAKGNLDPDLTISFTVTKPKDENDWCLSFTGNFNNFFPKDLLIAEITRMIYSVNDG